MSYEWFTTNFDEPVSETPKRGAQPATREELFAFMERLEDALTVKGFFYPEEKRESMVRNLRNIWHRADLREQDLRTLHGVIKALSSSKTFPENDS